MRENQVMNAGPADPSTMGGTRTASTIALLAGIWLFVSPWVYGAYTNGNAWNSWIVGGFVMLFAIIRLAMPRYSTVLSWCNTVLGVWVFFSPWIFGYAGTNEGRFINSLCVGVILFATSIASAVMSSRHTAPPAQRV